MVNYRLTQKAVDDLSNIWDYTVVNWSEKQADIYYNLLIRTFRDLAENPLLGKMYEQVGTGLLGYRVNKHVIFYLAQGEKEILIVRVLHGTMDFEERINE